MKEKQIELRKKKQVRKEGGLEMIDKEPSKDKALRRRGRAEGTKVLFGKAKEELRNCAVKDTALKT